jgi:parvulin-like peptidyl-prolyl cis-trans isomerase-like protein
MKKCIGSSYSIQVMIIASLVLLPGCALLDSIFGPSEKQEVKNEFESEAAQKHESVKDVAVEVLTEDNSVVPDEGLTGEVLVTMNGKPIVTVDSLKVEEDKLLEANPELKQMLAFMDQSQLDRNLAEGLMNQAMVDQAITEKGINKTDAYKKEIKEGFKAVERMINTKFFTQSFNIKISDADIRTYYDANKDSIPQLVVSRGGVKAMGIQFDTEAEAKAFAAQIPIQGNDMQKVAQAMSMGDKVRDFMTVNPQTVGIDVDVKNKILAATKFPAVEIVKSKDNKFWVIIATAKEETQYRPFDQIKAGIKEHLEKEEQAKQFNDEMNKLKERFKVKMSETFFAPESAETIDLEQALPEDLMSQLEDDDVSGTLAYYDAQRTTSA